MTTPEEYPHPGDYDERRAATPAEPVMVEGGLLYIPASSADARNVADIERAAREYVARHPDLGPDTTIEPVRTDAHYMQLVATGRDEDPWGLRTTSPGHGDADHGPESPGVFLSVGRDAEAIEARRLAREREQGVERARMDGALGDGDELTREGRVEEAAAVYGDAHRHDHQAAEFGADADNLRYEAANAYSTTVAGPPGPKNAGAQQKGQQPAAQPQQQQTPQRRVR